MKQNVLNSEKYLNVKAMRNKFGLKQSDLAKVIGCSSSNFAGKENGLYIWRLSECKKVQDFFNNLLVQAGEDPVTLDDLFLSTKCQI